MTGALKKINWITVVGFFVAIGVGSGILVFAGERPTLLIEALLESIFTGFGLGYTLYYATPLIFTGLSVALCFQCGLFNIGAEGQLHVGAIFLIAASVLFSWLPPPLSILVGCLAAGLGGALWGRIAGWLKAARGSHEVITTILLNFIASCVCSYFILYVFPDAKTQNPQTIGVGSAFSLWTLSDLLEPMGIRLFSGTPVNLTLLLAVLTAVVVSVFLSRTPTGFEMRAVGLSPHAARMNGISVTQNTVLVFTLAGALSGLVSVNEIMGYHHHLMDGFSPGYGFTGIAVALIAGNRPLGILGSAFLFGWLHNSARELEFLGDRSSKELAMVIQAILIACVVSPRLFKMTGAGFMRAFGGLFSSLSRNQLNLMERSRGTS